MRILQWLVFLPLNLLLGVFSFILAPFAVLLFSSPDKLHLVRFKWLETIDNDLTGDAGWKAEHLLGADPLSAINRIRWLWRNGGNTVNYKVLGVMADPDWIGQQDRSLYFWRRPDGYWLYRRFFPLAGAYKLELFFGWALLGPQLGLCKFVCQIRIKKNG